MTVLARDAVAADHLVYAWPFPIGPECEVTCRDDEQVVMCPAWLVGDRLGPGHHRWRTPDPTRPVSAYFVLLAPVEVQFDMTTSFLVPHTGQPVRLRANGSLLVRCTDPALLVAQFVGLPFDNINDGVLRSVSRSVERMIARLLTRRVVMAGTPLAVTDAGMKSSIIEELVAYNPAAGAVFGIELMRMGYLTIAADDGSSPYFLRVAEPAKNGNGHTRNTPSSEQSPLRAVQTSAPDIKPPVTPASGPTVASGEIVPRSKSPSNPPGTVKKDSSGGAQVATSSGEIVAKEPRRAKPFEVPNDEVTQPSMATPLPGTMRAPTPVPVPVPATASDAPSRGAIMGIGMSAIGGGGVAGEIVAKVKPGGRVLVPGPNGLMQSATVKQLLQGYYELEVGSSGETIWVPINGVVPES